MLDTAPYQTLTEKPHPPAVVFSVNGAHAGPRLIVTGADGVLRSAAEKLWELRDLVAMRGKLELRSGPLGDVGDPADDMMHLSAEGPLTHLRILGRMTALGMISGRGVPVRFIN